LSTTVQRRVVGAIVAIVVVTTCIMLGRWQWHRHEDRAARVEQITQNYDRSPVPLSDLVSDPSGPLRADVAWRSVELRGQFGDPVVKIRNRPVDGQPGFHIAQPFFLADGPVVLVNRGFVRTENEDSLDLSIQSATDVELVAHLRPSEEPDARSAPVGQGFTFNPEQLLPGIDNLAANFYVIAESQTPPGPDQIVALPAPDTDLGSHFSYALQWWFFAGGAVVAFIILMRRENQHEGTQRPPKQRISSAEAEEDALIAAWEEEHQPQR